MFNRTRRHQKKATHSEISVYIMRSLARKEWGYARLLGRMKERFPANDHGDLSQVLDEYVQDGLQSDARYAEMYMRQCRDTRGYGPNKVAAKLREHQISSTIAEQYLFADHPIWDLRAHEQRMKRFGDFPDNAEDTAKQSRFLQQRGFTFSQIKQAMTPGVEHEPRSMVPPEDDMAEPVSFEALYAFFDETQQ